jgi:hypothetical protein
MRFTVTWLPVPEAELEKLWIAAPDRKEVEEAANWIDRQLLNDPLKKLTAVDAFYFLRRDPLIILCEVSVDDRLVSIVEVHRTDL